MVMLLSAESSLAFSWVVTMSPALPSAGWVWAPKVRAPSGRMGPQGGQTLGGGGHDALVGLHGEGLLLADLDVHRDHVALLEGPVVGHGHQVLLIALQGQGVGLLLGNPAVVLAHQLGGHEHGLPAVGVLVEVVHHPVFAEHLAAGAVGVGPHGVRSVGAAVGGGHQVALVGPALHPAGGGVHGGGAGGAGLAHRGPGDAVVAHEGAEPGVGVEPGGHADGHAEGAAVEHLGVDAPEGQEFLGGGRRQFHGVLVLQRALPAAEG